MKATLLHEPFLIVRDICDGFVYNELEGKGLFGWKGNLTIQPEYQRNYIYADGKKDAKFLSVRVFDRKTAKTAYAKQTEDAKRRNVSNCPLCAIGH